MGDDVVELSGDPRALLRDGDPRRGLALSLGLCCARLGGVRLLGAGVERKAGEPGDTEQEGDIDELTRRVPRPVEDDRHHAGEDDRETHAREQGVAQVPEQECREDPGEIEARGVRDQPAVDERERCCQEPERRRRAERKATPCEKPEHDHRGRRDAEPEGRLRGVAVVAPDRDLQHGRTGEDDDHSVEPPSSRDPSQAAHALNVLLVRPCRLLPG